jgi:hypothetical protein
LLAGKEGISKSYLIDYPLKSSAWKSILKIMASGRKFAEHRGLEDAERIDNDPLILYFSKKNNTFVV